MFDLKLKYLSFIFGKYHSFQFLRVNNNNFMNSGPRDCDKTSSNFSWNKFGDCDL